jgi:hypothetical protein
MCYFTCYHSSTQHIIMNPSELNAYHHMKTRKKQSSNVLIKARIHEAWTKYVQGRGLHFRPFIFQDDGSHEAKQFLQICRFEGCLFDRLFEKVFICGKHLCVHHCRSNSDTCVVIHGKHGTVFCQFSGTDLSRHQSIGTVSKESIYIYVSFYHITMK